MKLEDGKYYLTSDGYKVGPIVGFGSGKWFYREGVEEVWGADGKNKYSGVDLIAEWTDEPQTGTLAELNVKPGDVVAIGDDMITCIDVELSGGAFGYTHLMQMENANVIWCGGGYDVDKWRIISRASTTQSPVRTVTRKEIVPGVYGKVSVLRSDGWWFAFTDNGDQVAHVNLTSDELTAAIETLTAIRDALENNA